jgi:VanZ family protein
MERFITYAVLGALFMAAYPRHFIRLAALLAALAMGLEALQHLTPDRHGHLADAIQKILGAWAGCATFRLVMRVGQSWSIG